MRNIVVKTCRKLGYSVEELFKKAALWKWSRYDNVRLKEEVKGYFDGLRNSDLKIPPHVREYAKMRLDNLPANPKREEPPNYRPSVALARH